MKKAVILHGTQGSPEGNWFRWLESELQTHGYEVWLPLLPDAEQPSLSRWLKFVEADSPFELDKDTIVIGHSSGAILGLLLLQTGYQPGSVAMVSIFADNSLGWEPNDRLFDVPFEYEKLIASPTQRLIINSDTDPYVPLVQAQTIAANSKTELVIIPGQGHFNLEQSPDYVRFPQLLDILKQHDMV